MIIMRRIPMTALQTGLFSLLSAGQTTPVYDDVPENAVLPYITIGAFTCKRLPDKTSDIWESSLQIHIWSDYNGKAEINAVANDIATVVSSASIEAPGFFVISQDVDFFEAFAEEEFGYHGVLTVVITIQNTGG
ncbi:DUF3168 domain-containing protein [Anaeroselena agilis]|uniref:DUF3168 domain-containing protein n=1 Tax=Anaeroselena agilis TaxID=3063788 RepID=A0ABU3NUC1_9FIRM|nr:DUF3168 domain-containing protein [Selenomonadales bacterium 4137-cl]